MEILGVRVDEVNYQEALERIYDLLRKGGKYYVVTPNPEIVSYAQRDQEFKEILNQANLKIPDGIGLALASKILGGGLSSRVTGVDLVDGLAALAEEHGLAMFLLGGRDGVALRAAEVLTQKYPGLNIVGTYEGNAAPEFDSETCSALRIPTNVPIDILLVGFGHPKQEKWIARNLEKIPVKLAVGVGGSFDFISGKVKRAPKFVQKTGLEWLWRLILQPWRIKRQVVLPYFGYLVIKEKFKKN